MPEDNNYDSQRSWTIESASGTVSGETDIRAGFVVSEEYNRKDAPKGSKLKRLLNKFPCTKKIDLNANPFWKGDKETEFGAKSEPREK
ncbi:hypothetical protein AAP_05726 [Ascosphaera apis ARSEF 7405]|uniref:Uncharacterized protein n=1 Tax=Ascosphaera apis ARSEF 7405 TaxID=392613 RepID=A0A167VCP4_9EURO|nr:hypothetical protein AAP_05726 [Ascosphaera apis ARSEF 7405]